MKKVSYKEIIKCRKLMEFIEDESKKERKQS